MIELSTRRLNGFLVFTSVSDEMSPTLVGIPVYLPILLKVATGFSNNPGGDAFSSWMNDVNQIGAAFKKKEIKHCPGALVNAKKSNSTACFVQVLQEHLNDNLHFRK